MIVEVVLYSIKKPINKIIRFALYGFIDRHLYDKLLLSISKNDTLLVCKKSLCGLYLICIEIN